MVNEQEAKDAMLAVLVYQAVGADLATGKVTITDAIAENMAYEIVVTRDKALRATEFGLKEKPKKEEKADG